MGKTVPSGYYTEKNADYFNISCKYVVLYQRQIIHAIWDKRF